MTIFYTLYEAIPLPESEEFEVCGGAYVSCWLKAQSEEEASRLALAVIHERGWKVVSVEEECWEVTAVIYSDDDESRGFYDQAVSEGECCVFHLWPIDDQESGDVH